MIIISIFMRSNGMNGITQMARAEESDEFITKQNQAVPSV